jgi:hypothetical protein
MDASGFASEPRSELIPDCPVSLPEGAVGAGLETARFPTGGTAAADSPVPSRSIAENASLMRSSGTRFVATARGATVLPNPEFPGAPCSATDRACGGIGSTGGDVVIDSPVAATGNCGGSVLIGGLWDRSSMARWRSRSISSASCFSKGVCPAGPVASGPRDNEEIDWAGSRSPAP